MRNFLLLIALLLNLSAFAQLRFDYPIKEIEPIELIVTFSLKYQEDSLNPDFIRQEDMLLFIGKKTSKFTSSDNFIFDTTMRRISSVAELQSFLSDPNKFLPRTSFSYNIFKNYPKDKITCIEHTLDGTFKYEESIDLFNWELTGETDTIGGYKAQKALSDFGGRKWIAWFSSEIPYNDGPYKFNGLPGLIIKAYDDRNHYLFEMVSVERPPQKLMIDYSVKDFIETTKENFFRAKDAFRVDIVNRLKASGASSEIQQKMARGMKKENNPMELKRK